MTYRISFQFFHRTHDPISNDLQFRIRKRVAEMMRTCEFGEITEAEDSKFVNQYAIPITDDYFIPENDLFISYRFGYPIIHGNLGRLLNNEIPELEQTFIRNDEIVMVSRCLYLSED